MSVPLVVNNAFVSMGSGISVTATYTTDGNRMAIFTATTSTGKVLTVRHMNALLTTITIGATADSFTCGNFALRNSIKISSRTLPSYGYTSRANYRATIDYGNRDKVQYEYDK